MMSIFSSFMEVTLENGERFVVPRIAKIPRAPKFSDKEPEGFNIGTDMTQHPKGSDPHKWLTVVGVRLLLREEIETNPHAAERDALPVSEDPN